MFTLNQICFIYSSSVLALDSSASVASDSPDTFLSSVVGWVSSSPEAACSSPVLLEDSSPTVSSVAVSLSAFVAFSSFFFFGWFWFRFLVQTVHQYLDTFGLGR
jgi:hypothetical protein